MQVGDVVKKVGGDRHLNRVGLITKVYNQGHQYSHTIIEVLLDGQLVKWPGHCVEVLNEYR